MSELTKEQVERAARAAFKCFNHEGDWTDSPIPSESMRNSYREAVRAAAPFLQLPWDEPTARELEMFHQKISKNLSPWIVNFDCRHALLDFMACRNAALLQKPVDPRRARLVEALFKEFGHQLDWNKKLDNILAALDEVK